MSQWEQIQKCYPTQHPLTEEEQLHTPLCFTEVFAAYKFGTWTLFALFDRTPVWTEQPNTGWRYSLDNSEVTQGHVLAWFPHYKELTALDPYRGVASFQDKAVYWHYDQKAWKYLNHCTVHFNGSEASETEPAQQEESEEGSSEEENDTLQVDALLESAERSISFALQKVTLPETLTATSSSLPRDTGSQSLEPSQVPTPPVSKGPVLPPRSPTRPCPLVPTASSSRTPPVTPFTLIVPAQPSTPFPPGPAQPAMAQAATPRLIGTAPEPFTGKGEHALPFWNSLENYYHTNNDAFADDNKKVAAALTHFKVGTQAGNWASDRMATALLANPVTYGTWAQFKTDFKDQFIPPKTQAEAIKQVHSLVMGNRDFNEWYQEWSQFA